MPQSLQSFFSAFLTSQHFFFSATVLTAQQDFLGAAFAAGFVWAITLVVITAIARARIKFFMLFSFFRDMSCSVVETSYNDSTKSDIR